MDPFRATDVIAETAYRNAKAAATRIKGFANTTGVQLTSTKNSDFILMIFHESRRMKDELAGHAAVPGIAQFAKDAQIDQNYDVISAFMGMQTALENIKVEILNTFPTDGSGYLLEKKFNAQGTYDFRQFTPAQTAPLRTLLTALSATIS